MRASHRRADEGGVADDPDAPRLTEPMKQRELQLLMLSNQLPLLEPVQDPKEVTGRAAEIVQQRCTWLATDERLMS